MVIIFASLTTKTISFSEYVHAEIIKWQGRIVLIDNIITDMYICNMFYVNTCEQTYINKLKSNQKHIRPINIIKASYLIQIITINL